MNLFTIAFRNILQRRLPSLLTGLSVALGVMLMVMVLTMHSAVESAFNQRSIAYDLIIGPKGSDLQLVLSSVFRIQPPIEKPALQLLRNRFARINALSRPFRWLSGTPPNRERFRLWGPRKSIFRNEYAPGRAVFRFAAKIAWMTCWIHWLVPRWPEEMVGMSVTSSPSSTAVRTAPTNMRSYLLSSACWLPQAHQMTEPCLLTSRVFIGSTAMRNPWMKSRGV